MSRRGRGLAGGLHEQRHPEEEPGQEQNHGPEWPHSNVSEHLGPLARFPAPNLWAEGADYEGRRVHAASLPGKRSEPNGGTVLAYFRERAGGLDLPQATQASQNGAVNASGPPFSPALPPRALA
jgi:hypothetical protein